MKLKALIEFLENLAPPKFQESYDNAGLIVGTPEQEISSVLIALDSTEEVIQEAIDNGHNVVIAHHPIIFSGLKKINGKNYIERAIIKAIKNDIAIFAIHTNLDNVLVNGVNAKIAEKLGLQNIQILVPKSELSDDNYQVGSGIIGAFANAKTPQEFLAFLKHEMQTSIIRHTKILDQSIKNVAVCGGSGRFLLEKAIQANADAFISADFKYHEFFDANDQILIADIGHYESEQFTIELLQMLINENFSTFAAHSTRMVTNPIKYF